MSVLTVLLITLVACQGANDGAERGTDNPNIDPTTNRNMDGRNTGEGMFQGDGINNTDQDYMFERNADRNQGRNGERNQINQGNDSQYDVSNEAAERITDELDEIDNAYVLTTENNAYVAANLDIEDEDRTHNRNQSNNRNSDDHELSDELEKKIGEIVRDVDSDIDNVYVSSNPDFLNLTTNYAEDMDEGRPIGGMFDQLGEMIDRLFPDNVTR